jgi:hypothetical protein
MRHLVVAALVGALLGPACRSDSRPPAADKPPPARPDATAPPPRAMGTPLEGHLVSQATIDRIVASGTREQWFGLFLQGKKVGYASLGIRPTRAGEPGGLVWAVAARLRMSAGGTTVDVDLEEQRFYQSAPPYRLMELRSLDRSNRGQVERRFRRDGDQMIAAQTVDGATQPERRIPASGETALSMLDQQAVEPAEVRAGMSTTVTEFDSERETDKATAVKVVEIRKQRLSGVDTEVAVLSSQTEGEATVSRSVIASGAVILDTTLGAGIEIRWQEKAQAQSDVAGFDMIADAVKVDRPLGEASAIRELHLRVTAPPALRLRDAPNQELTRRADGGFDVALFSRPGLPVMPSERQAALAVSSSIDAGHPAIAELARSVTAGESDPARRVERLVAWTYQNLAKELSTNLTTASQVLAHKQGDCSEHALLFVALARAAGIPAREVSGLVYMGDDIQRFGWHAWAEVDLGGRWVQVDPSWGEPLANATHLTLGVGEDTDWVSALGGLDIKLAER